MLLLYRCQGQTIRINDDITIVITETGRNQVRIGIDAPREIAVHRGEVYDKIQRDEIRSRPDT